MDRIELAGGLAVAFAQTAELAAGIAAVEAGHHLAGSIAVIHVGTGTAGQRAVAADDGHLRSGLLDGAAERLGDLGHYRITADRAEEAFHARSLHHILGEGVASCLSAAAAIGSG